MAMSAPRLISAPAANVVLLEGANAHARVIAPDALGVPTSMGFLAADIPADPGNEEAELSWIILV